MSEMFAGGVLGFFVGWFVTVFIINWTEDHNKSQGTCEAPKREWVGLTEVEIRYALREWAETNQTVREMLYAIEDKLKEKNA